MEHNLNWRINKALYNWLQIARALEGNLPLEELDEGIKPGHSKLNGSQESSDFDTAQYREELRKFQKMAFESQNNSSGLSALTSNFGQRPSGSSSETRDSSVGVKQIPIDWEVDIGI